MTPVTSLAQSPTGFDVDTLRAEFPILVTRSRGKQLVYLDSASTSQKPAVVIDAIRSFYATGNANIHRGVYQLSENATQSWDEARRITADFIGATDPGEIVFVRGTTEAINLVARSLITPRLAGRTVIVTEMEHHANIVPWQLAGAVTVPIPMSDDGTLDLAAAERLLANGPALLAVTHVSNAIGTINPIAELCRMANAAGVPVLVDGAQAVPHYPVDVTALGCDFYCFSAHKVFGPTGFGVLWARSVHLATMEPYQGGGDMIDTVSFDQTTFADAPRKFEAGTPHIAGAVGLTAALRWVGAQDRDALRRHEDDLLEYATERLQQFDRLRIVGRAAQKAPVLAFTLDTVHPHDIASMLDGDGICVRAGHHCTQPLHRRLGLTATVRASFAPYNTRDEVDALADSLLRICKVFA
jgi:cysteine desulfurase/selenocysteine lyase